MLRKAWALASMGIKLSSVISYYSYSVLFHDWQIEYRIFFAGSLCISTVSMQVGKSWMATAPGRQVSLPFLPTGGREQDGEWTQGQQMMSSNERSHE